MEKNNWVADLRYTNALNPPPEIEGAYQSLIAAKGPRVKGTLSVGKVLNKIFPTFDQIAMATKTSNNMDSPHFGKPVEEIIAIWNSKSTDAIERGLKVDDEISEVFYAGRITEDERILSCKSRLERNKMFPVVGQLWVNDGLINGKIDDIYWHSVTPKLYLSDYKTCEDVEKLKVGYKKLNGPLSHLRDSKFLKYSLQLGLYKYILLKNNPDLDFGNSLLVFFEPDRVVFEKALEFSPQTMQEIVSYALEN